MNTINQLRTDTIKFTFDRSFVRPKASEIKHWFIEKVQITENDVVGVHLSFVSNAAFVKLQSPELCNTIVDKRGCVIKFNHSNPTVRNVIVSHAGLGIRTVRIFELPFEIPAEEINDVLRSYGRILSDVAEKWSEAYMFPVLNGVRQVKIEFQRNIPSFINVCGYRTIVIYDGQFRTCALCNSTEHFRSECSKRCVPQLPNSEVVEQGQAVSLKLTYAAATYPRGPAEPSTPGQG